MVTLLTTTALLIFVIYCIYIFSKFGFLDSISESSYRLDKIGKKWMFSAMCWSLACFLIYPLNSVADAAWLKIVVSYACAGLLFVGTAFAFKDHKAISIVHYSGAVLAVVCALIFVAYTNIVVLIIFLAIYVVYTLLSILMSKNNSLTERFVNSNPITVVEIVAILSVFVTLYIEIL